MSDPCWDNPAPYSLRLPTCPGKSTTLTLRGPHSATWPPQCYVAPTVLRGPHSARDWRLLCVGGGGGEIRARGTRHSCALALRPSVTPSGTWETTRVALNQPGGGGVSLHPREMLEEHHLETRKEKVDEPLQERQGSARGEQTNSPQVRGSGFSLPSAAAGGPWERVEPGALCQ
ncbi:unnamed protein product [Lota lota]